MGFGAIKERTQGHKNYGRSATGQTGLRGSCIQGTPLLGKRQPPDSIHGHNFPRLSLQRRWSTAAMRA